MDTAIARAPGLSASDRRHPSRKLIHTEMLKFVKPSTGLGVALFASDYGLYVAALAGILFLDPLWAKILCSMFAGVKISNLVTLAHDAAHGSLVRAAGLNKWLAIFAFMPGLFNYRLWVYDHHLLHHPKVNGKFRDSFTPFSKADYDSLPPHRRMLERIYRAPCGVGLGLYQLVERWLGVKLFPRIFMPERVRAEAWPHFAFLMGYLALFLAGLALAPAYSSTSSGTALALGFFLPYAIWMMLIGFTLYVQHTHARVPWFDEPVDRAAIVPPEVLTTHIEFPGWLKAIMHNVYDHAAHHVQPRIPCYRLAAAQARLNELVGPRAVKTDFSFRWFADTVRRCKLYDYENHNWVDFDGKPTTGRLYPEMSQAEAPFAENSIRA